MSITLQAVTDFLLKMLSAVAENLRHNYLVLTFAILIAVVMQVYINTDKLKKVLLARPKVSIVASVAFGAFTPLCACGTMAVVIGMLTTTLPWGAIMAFLTSSPLMSPDGFIMLAGVISLQFAIALTIASVIIGLSSGYLTHLIETKTDFLKNQTRFAKVSIGENKACDCSKEECVQDTCGCETKKVKKKKKSCDCSAETTPSSACCEKAGRPVRRVTTNSKLTMVKSLTTVKSLTMVKASTIDKLEAPQSKKHSFFERIKGRELLSAFLNTGLKQILLFFSIFVAVGFVINSFVPTSLIVALFSPDSIFAVPLAALIGLPLYVSGDAAIPLIKALMSGGAGEGAMLAFMITGQATSAWVIVGIASFMKKRMIGLYIGFIMTGGILLGYLYDFVLKVMA